MPRRRKSPAKPRRLPGEAKRDATRRHILEHALALFRAHGVDATTMREIATAAGLSLGATYYYFPSKEALVFAFYDANQDAMEAVATTGSLRDQLGALLHGKLRSLRDERPLLGTIVQRLVDPGDPLSAFSAETRAVRERAIELFERPLRATGLPTDTVRLVAHALWLFQLAVLLVFLHDASPNERRTHGLVDDALDLIVPLLPLCATPMGRGACERIIASLDRAGIAIRGA